MRRMNFLVAPLLVLANFGVSLILSAPKATASMRADGPSASGHGTILVQNEQGQTVRRQFSFSAKQLADGTVQGSAVIQNPQFDPRYKATFDITCLLVVGNRASLGGDIKTTSDPAFNDEFDTGFFTVFDNGEPGKGVDTISLVF